MSRLIDAEEYEQALIANGWDESDNEFSAEGVFELLREAPTVQAILLDQVKQARAEMEDKSCYGCLRIMDKLIETAEQSREFDCDLLDCKDCRKYKKECKGAEQ